jgi:hypothetical protein
MVEAKVGGGDVAMVRAMRLKSGWIAGTFVRSTAGSDIVDKSYGGECIRKRAIFERFRRF